MLRLQVMHCYVPGYVYFIAPQTTVLSQFSYTRVYVNTEMISAIFPLGYVLRGELQIDAEIEL